VCKKGRDSEEFEQIILGLDKPVQLYDAVGCTDCGGLGYRGRTLVVEVLVVNDELDEMIATKATAQQFRRQAKASGFKTMAEEGLRLVLEGQTTIEELSRVVDLTAGLN